MTHEKVLTPVHISDNSWMRSLKRGNWKRKHEKSGKSSEKKVLKKDKNVLRDEK